jgi:hypothetical protein
MIADLGGLRLFPTHNNRRPQSETGYHAEQHAPILAMQMWRSTISPLARRRHEVPLFAMTTGFSWFPCFLAVGPFVRRLGSTSQLLHVVAVIKSRRHPTGLAVVRAAALQLLHERQCWCPFARGPEAESHCGTSGPGLGADSLFSVGARNKRSRSIPLSLHRGPWRVGFEFGRAMVPRNWASRERPTPRQTRPLIESVLTTRSST